MLNIPCLQLRDSLSHWLIRHLPTITVPKCKRPSKNQVPSVLPTVFYVEKKEMSIAWIDLDKSNHLRSPFWAQVSHPYASSPWIYKQYSTLDRDHPKSNWKKRQVSHGDMWILKKEDVSNLSHNYHALWTIGILVVGSRRVYLISTTSHGDPRISGLK